MTPSTTYQSIWRAVRERKQMTCVFEGRYRETCPVILGYSSDGRERVLVFQIGGQTSSKSKLPGWRSFYLADIRDLRLRDGPWAEGDSHAQTQSHIRFVDVDTNITATLMRPNPLPFGSPELLPPRRLVPYRSSLSFRLRCPSVRSRSALRRMKPSASRWS